MLNVVGAAPELRDAANPVLPASTAVPARTTAEDIANARMECYAPLSKRFIHGRELNEENEASE